MTELHDNNFNDLPNDDEVMARARSIFKCACESADSYHMLRLGAARRKALDAGTPSFAARAWAPLAGAAVACCALVVGLALMRPVAGTAPPATVSSSASIPAEPVESADAVPEVGSTQMEMVQNLDFYRWLASQRNVAAATPGDEP